MAELDQVVTDRRLHRGLLEQGFGGLEGDDLYLDEFRVDVLGGSSGELGSTSTAGLAGGGWLLKGCAGWR
jgi:hypothetical protein